jgi:drug/metabolite transporter, DME family
LLGRLSNSRPGVTIGRVSSPPPATRPGLLGLSPVAAGTACCVVSALGYTAAYICLRQLAALGSDPTWSICVKEAVAVSVVGPWLLIAWLRGAPTVSWGRPLAMLVLAGLATQLANTGVQWAQGVVGLAVTVPTVSAVMLTASAILGRVVLGEVVSLRTVTGIGLLCVSLALLGMGAGQSSASNPSAGALAAISAVGACCAAGVAYALLSITVRHCVTGTTRLAAVVLVVTGMGIVSLGPLSVCRLGVEPLLHTPPEQLLWMVVAGVFNLVAFFALSKGLQLTTVVHVNVLNASQVALSAVAGIALFHEAHSGWLTSGVAMTIVGIIVFDRPTGEQPADQHV